MKTAKVTVVRVYITEGEKQLSRLLKRLREQEKVRGFSVFRAISGLGPSGEIHDASVIDLSLDLPLVVEFFDTPEKVESILAHIGAGIKPGHILTWDGRMNIAED